MTILLRQKPLPQVVRQIVQRDNGAWLDPEDMSTMYQDAAGTTPVTALEQPVGLWLDKSQGLELGPEVTPWSNGFTSLTGVAPVEATLELVGSEIITTSTQGNSDRTEYALTGLTIGKTYKIKIKARRGTGVKQNFNMWTFCSISLTNITQSTTEEYDFNVVATSTSGVIRVYANAASGGSIGDSVIVSSISVRELRGNHATQSVTASRPTLSARYNWLLNSAALSTQSVTTVATPYTLSFTGTGSVTLSGSATGTLAGTGANNRVSLAFTPTAGTLTLTITGSVTLAMLAFGTLTTYQAITTATSYDSSGWNRYVRFDGIDDYLNLPYMGLYANGSASVVFAASLPPQSSNYNPFISERNSTIAGPAYVPLRNAILNTLDVFIRNDATSVIIDSSDVNGQINTGVCEILSCVDSGSVITTRKNSSTLSTQSYTRTGLLTLTNTVIGAQITTSNTFLNHNNYGLIITESALSDTDRRRCEQFLAGRLSNLGVALS